VAGRFVLMLTSGILLFGIGGLARTYMNVRIAQALSDGSTTRSTELKYLSLVRKNDAPMWQLVITVIFIPLGILTSFAAIIWSNHLGAQ